MNIASCIDLVEDIRAIIDEYRPVAQQIKQIIDLLTPESVQRVRSMEEGNEIDLNAATLFFTAIEAIGDPFAIHGLDLDGRHDLHY